MIRRILIGIVLGIAITLTFQFAYRQYRWRQMRGYLAFAQWEQETLPGILNSHYVFDLGVQSSDRGGGSTEHEALVLYEVTNTFKVIRIRARSVDGNMIFPTVEEIRELDSKASSMPAPTI